MPVWQSGNALALKTKFWPNKPAGVRIPQPAPKHKEETDMINVLFAFAIFISIWFTFANLCKAVRGHRISGWNLAIMSAALTTVITHIIGVW